jgi:hypothetical protein
MKHLLLLCLVLILLLGCSKDAVEPVQALTVAEHLTSGKWMVISSTTPMIPLFPTGSFPNMFNPDINDGWYSFNTDRLGEFVVVWEGEQEVLPFDWVLEPSEVNGAKLRFIIDFISTGCEIVKVSSEEITLYFPIDDCQQILISIED